MEWNEYTINLNSIPWCKAAYEDKKFAFVADYVRFYALYNYGGLYLDTDVLIRKNFASLPHISECNFFSALEYSFNREQLVSRNIIDEEGAFLKPYIPMIGLPEIMVAIMGGGKNAPII